MKPTVSRKKTWGGFDLAILKIKKKIHYRELKSNTIYKSRSF